LAAVAGITSIFFSALHVNGLIAGFAYVLVVLLVAARWGLMESLATSVAATICLNYFFLPPVMSLTIADPQNWVALFVFLITALTGSQLSTTVRKRAAEAHAQRIEVERLYELSRALLLIDTAKDLGPQIATSIRDQCQFAAAAFCDATTMEIYIAGDPQAGIDRAALASLAGDKSAGTGTATRTTLADAEIILAPVAIGGQILGSLGLAGPSISEPAVQAITSLSAIALEHAHQQIVVSKLEVARQNERLRGVLLDALAHDFLTPLTSIKSAITAIRSEYTHDAEEDEFLSVAEEETNKLEEMVNEATDMARIEPGKPRIRRRQISVQDLIDAAIQRSKALFGDRTIDVEIPDHLPPLNADPEMMGLALRQLLGNAFKYSPPETPIHVSAFASDDMITVEVRDHGPGIPPDEMNTIFERFFRGKQVRDSVAGTGMGLSIARDIIHAHRGEIWVDNMQDGGARFSFRLPAFGERKRP
jgi:two-component system sensor histidine kinase KdpD